jgi:hypothetical protein
MTSTADTGSAEAVDLPTHQHEVAESHVHSLEDAMHALEERRRLLTGEDAPTD